MLRLKKVQALDIQLCVFIGHNLLCSPSPLNEKEKKRRKKRKGEGRGGGGGGGERWGGGERLSHKVDNAVGSFCLFTSKFVCLFVCFVVVLFVFGGCCCCCSFGGGGGGGGGKIRYSCCF